MRCIIVEKSLLSIRNRNFPTYSRYYGDEELTAVGIGSSVSHTQRVRSIVTKRRMKFIAKFTAPNTFSSRSRTQRVARLDHKSLNGPMEYVIVVVSVFAVNAEVFHRFGTFLGEHVQVDVSW